MLRQLLGDILSPEREAQLTNQHRIVFDHTAQGSGTFQVTLVARDLGRLGVTFSLSSSSSLSPPITATAPVVTSLVSSNTLEVPVGGSTSNETSVVCSAQKREVVRDAFKRRASDIHLADDEIVYLRIDGCLQPVRTGHVSQVDDYFKLNEQLKSQLSRGIAVELALNLSPHERLRVTMYRKQA